MLAKSLPQVMSLIKKTGDRCVIFDEHGEPYALLSLGAYERLVLGRQEEIYSLTEEELLDKINRDIAAWKAAETSSQTAKTWEKTREEGIKPASEELRDDFWGPEMLSPAEDDVLADEDDTYYLEKV